MPGAPEENSTTNAAALLAKSGELLDRLYAQSKAKDWQLSRAQFSRGLARSLAKRFGDGPCPAERFREYLETLYVEDLALACACLEGSERAWDWFVQQYRGYLRAAAGVITKGSRAQTDARELADSLFAELFGLADGKRGEHSLFRYFHGRSSLRTWLRTILAQRHIDLLRASRRWESLDGEDGELKPAIALRAPLAQLEADPHRERYVRLFVAALESCLGAMAPQDCLRLKLYYARQMTLAEIAKQLGEHESTASRNLERVRGELRAAIETELRGKSGLREAELLLCIQYAAEDSPIDFRQLFPEKEAGTPGAPQKEPS